MAILVCLGEYTLKDWNFSSVCSQGLEFSLCLICLKRLPLAKPNNQLNLPLFIADVNALFS